MAGMSYAGSKVDRWRPPALPPMLERMPADREETLELLGLAEAMAADIARYSPRLAKVYVICPMCPTGHGNAAQAASALADHVLAQHLGGAR